MKSIQTIEELQNKVNKLQEDEILLDVRTEAEFEQGHIEGALNFDISSPNIIQEIVNLDHSKTYIIYCKSGGRSQLASMILQQKAFKVINSSIGIIHWNKAGLELVK
ncbi:MAG: rhodanese-like domain-containing protein [Candidatus Paceibacterota bacterium]